MIMLTMVIFINKMRTLAMEELRMIFIILMRTMTGLPPSRPVPHLSPMKYVWEPRLMITREWGYSDMCGVQNDDDDHHDEHGD